MTPANNMYNNPRRIIARPFAANGWTRVRLVATASRQNGQRSTCALICFPQYGQPRISLPPACTEWAISDPIRNNRQTRIFPSPPSSFSPRFQQNQSRQRGASRAPSSRACVAQAGVATEGADLVGGNLSYSCFFVRQLSLRPENDIYVTCAPRKRPPMQFAPSRYFSCCCFLPHSRLRNSQPQPATDGIHTEAIPAARVTPPPRKFPAKMSRNSKSPGPFTPEPRSSKANSSAKRRLNPLPSSLTTNSFSPRPMTKFSHSIPPPAKKSGISIRT